jgi:hypothetical protein
MSFVGGAENTLRSFLSIKAVLAKTCFARWRAKCLYVLVTDCSDILTNKLSLLTSI